MLKPKLSTCIECNQTRYIYSRKMCQHCYWKSKPKKQIQKPTKQIAKFSKKHLTSLREYRKVRDVYLKENPICQFPNCNQIASDLHHGAGRVGRFLTDTKYFKGLCRPHHQLIETSPDLAKSLGLSFSRL